MTITMPAMTDAQTKGWQALLELHKRLPEAWTLVGGQMVHLHCAERGGSPVRPTDDLDAVLDVRALPQVLTYFTSALVELGFTSAGQSPQGHEHRWHNGDAVVDVLIPRHLGERAAGGKGATGSTTIETPGAQQALDRTEEVVVDVAGTVGTVRRPNLLGALVAKAAAITVHLDQNPARHRTDFAVLATLLAPSDRVEQAGRRDRELLNNMLGHLAGDKRTALSVDGATDALETLREILEDSASS